MTEQDDYSALLPEHLCHTDFGRAFFTDSFITAHRFFLNQLRVKEESLMPLHEAFPDISSEQIWTLFLGMEKTGVTPSEILHFHQKTGAEVTQVDQLLNGGARTPYGPRYVREIGMIQNAVVHLEGAPMTMEGIMWSAEHVAPNKIIDASKIKAQLRTASKKDGYSLGGGI